MQWLDHLSVLVENIVCVNCVLVENVLGENSETDIVGVSGDRLRGDQRVKLSFFGLSLQRTEGVSIFLTDIDTQIVEVTHLLAGDDGVGGTFLTGSCSSTRSMDVELQRSWKVIVNNIVQQWNINSSCRQVSNN